MDRRLSIPEAAKVLNVSEKTIRNRIKKGEINAELVDGKYAIKEQELLDSHTGSQSGNASTPELVAQLKTENEYLRNELSKAQEELSEIRKRSDTIILSLTQRLDDQMKMIEDMRKPQPVWQRVKSWFGFQAVEQ